ncbi:MAG: exopolyphosphatase, partial [Pseudomonadota bacterium]|nr:exopolyphosphatase [Pseudomonadota bacterium]
LAVMLNHARPEQAIIDFRLACDGDTLHLTLPETRHQALLLNDLEQEAAYQKAAGLTLNYDR